MFVLLPLIFALQQPASVDARRADSTTTIEDARQNSDGRGKGDRGRRREGRRIPLTAEHLATAYRDGTSRTLIARAREARLLQDSTLRDYDAMAYRRISAEMSLRETGRGRLLFRHETAARVRWAHDKGVWIDLKGARSVVPMFKGTEVEEEVVEDLADEGMAPIPYFPGREALWLPTSEGGPFAQTDVTENTLVNPIARGAEAYYTYRTGDSIAIRLAGGQGTVQLREIRVESREPRWNAIVGSFWFDVATGQLARAAYRLSVPMDLWAVAKEVDGEDPRDEVPAWVLPMISPMTGNITAVLIEYGLYEGRFWLPRIQVAEGKGRAGMMHIPFKVEQRYQYANVNGGSLDSLPPVAVVARGRRIAVEDSLVAGLDSAAADSARAAFRQLRRPNQCATGDTRVTTENQYEGALLVATRIPCDTALLSRAPELPPSIYDEGEELFGKAEMDQLLASLSIDLQPGWSPKRPEILWARARAQPRYNRVEGLSAGVGVRQILGRGYAAEGLLRLGHADLQPNAEVSLERAAGQKVIRYGAYRRLEAANDWGAPFGFGASLSALLFARDEGFYYRATGAEVVVDADRGSLLTLRLFAEDQRDVDVETQISVANVISGVRFIDNVDAEEGALVGASLRSRGSRGLDPQGFRAHSDLRLELGQGRGGYGRGALDLTVSRGLGRKLAAAVTGGAGASVGDLPPQRHWFLGGSHTVRGQRAGTAAGDAYWLGRAELGSAFVLARPTLFYDIAWAGDRADWRTPGRPMSGAGVGLSFMDGMVRVDLARGIAPSQRLRFDMYVEARF